MAWDNGTGQALDAPPTNCVYRENFKQLLLPPVYSVVLVVGLPLNACVIAQICMSRRALTRTAVYTLNLALADLLYACSLPLLIYNYAQGIQRNRTVCYDLSPPALATRYMPYGMTLTVIGFLLPFVALLACYCCLARRLCRQDGPAGPVAQERRGKAARMAVVVAAVFAISFLPFHVTKTAYLAVRSTPGVSCPVLEAFAAAYKVTRPFASANSVLDPILFYFTQKKFRQRPPELLQKLTAKWQRQGR